ncbi:hypothetical protein L6164_012744 [Bauhinia variegata]|uniref:Uncharacterized protein n=1 Tax=Bauhinia variegata TaxID=167791 RepID=A0ACB9PA03_BAUVA|nr:hypothetical protein L6164_012744 [Bauhinia variegata]
MFKYSDIPLHVDGKSTSMLLSDIFYIYSSALKLWLLSLNIWEWLLNMWAQFSSCATCFPRAFRKHFLLHFSVNSILPRHKPLRLIMEIDIPGHPNDHNTQGSAGSFVLRPVLPEENGEGLPYAPENWPEPGDIWSWRTGRRVANTGHFLDRYLYLPPRLSRIENSGSNRKKHGFASKLAVERYIRTTFPETDLVEFFASFSWKIPSPQCGRPNGNEEKLPIAAVPLKQVQLAEEPESDVQHDTVRCKAGNNMCNGLILEEVEKYSPAMPCDVCCSERDFCRDCCCILCCKTVNSANGGYSYIKCQKKVDDKICGHVAHMECALRSRNAGTVGGKIGLDAEYNCRSCDGRTDLISHVDKLLETCKIIDCQDDIEKILHLGACLLRGSQKTIAKELLSHIELANSKLKCGTPLEDIWKVDHNLTAHSAGFSDSGHAETEVVLNGSPSDVITETKSYGCLSDSLKLEVEIDNVLQNLRKSQEFEYNIAEERLYVQKKYLQDLYQQLENEKSELACQNSSLSSVLLRAVREREDQIRRELLKFGDMKKVANGFGRTSKDILKEHFDLEIAD